MQARKLDNAQSRFLTRWCGSAPCRPHPTAATENESTAFSESARTLARSENHDRPSDECDSQTGDNERGNMVHSVMRAATIAGCVETLCAISLKRGLADRSLKRALADVRILQAGLRRADLPTVPRCIQQPTRPWRGRRPRTSWSLIALPHSRKFTTATAAASTATSTYRWPAL
jgi:hypothetical protein